MRVTYIAGTINKPYFFMMQQCARFFMIVIMSIMAGNTFALHYELQNQQDTTEAPKDWFLRDAEADHIVGVSAEKAYSTLLQGKPSRTILVAVIDSGIDIDHEDLKDVIWLNEDEIPGNNIDDDKNGYIDDVHGWNFIGGKKGNVSDDTYELTREYVKLKPKYENVDESKIRKKQKAKYERWKSIKSKFETASKAAQQKYDLYSTLYENIEFGNDTLKKILGVDKINMSLLDELKSDDKRIEIAKGSLALIFQNAGADADIDTLLLELKEAVKYFEVQAKYGYNTSFDSRLIVGDNYSDLYEKGYGNNDVKGPDPLHGTHVAGIIGANRKNSIGIKGIADNVLIMPIRAVPNGDERDKDVANAIIYAVDNGARIVNMSFGKSYSPEKIAVDKAVKYAESKGVLLIHAAGNDGDNNDTDENYPTRYYNNGKEAKNWLEIGASAWGVNNELVAPFSNYGKKSVDLFAPGVDIYSTTPGNTYKDESGTSMASPTTTGVAALVMSYFPDLTYKEIKNILRQSTRKFDNIKVVKPGSKDEEIEFSKLSSTGGIVNAYEAVRLAQNISKKAE